MEINTIGLAGRSAQEFFETLVTAGVMRVVDVRLNNTSQLAGFSKRSDLPYFLSRIAGIEYRHEPMLAPTAEMLTAYRKKRVDWPTYAESYQRLLVSRGPEHVLDASDFERAALLCSERAPTKCHRRLAAEHLARFWRADVVHL
jgi:uncharacterized protein (DUF488 family)